MRENTRLENNGYEVQMGNVETAILQEFNSSQLAKMKKSIPDMSLPWNL